VKAFISCFKILLKENPRGYTALIRPNDVPASKLIEKLAKHLRENVDAVTPPAWTIAAKTGTHVGKQPQKPDWWYTRCAAIMRKIYVHGPVGIERLRAEYGGGKRHGSMPRHASKAGGSTVRKAMQQLEAAGLIEPAKPHGRRLSREGRKLLQELAEGVGKELIKQMPELEKYQNGE
jgi:small subunit ribosomal protein S19e